MQCQKELDSVYGNEIRANKHFLDKHFFKVSYAFESVKTYVYLIILWTTQSFHRFYSAFWYILKGKFLIKVATSAFEAALASKKLLWTSWKKFSIDYIMVKKNTLKKMPFYDLVLEQKKKSKKRDDINENRKIEK